MKKYLHRVRLENDRVTAKQFEFLEKFGFNKKDNDGDDEKREDGRDIKIDDYWSGRLVDISLFSQYDGAYRIEDRIEVEFESNIIPNLMEYVERFENLAKSLSNTYNDKCNVHIGGNALMTINKTKLLTDSCTDLLQEELDKGWRIIAACVQPDGRRPDYVLGRYEPEIG